MSGLDAPHLVADGLAFAEGPVELPDGSIAFVQMASDLVTVIDPQGNRRDLPCPGGPNGMALEPCGRSVVVCLNGGLSFARDAGGRLVPGIASSVAARGGLGRLDLSTGAIEVLIERGPQSPTSGPNDVVRPPSGSVSAGGVWFTDLGRRLQDSVEPGGVFYRGDDGDLVRAAYPRPGRPNGIATSRDGTTLYVTESLSAQVWSWRIEGPGRLGEPRLLHQFAAPARLDGMAVTAAGNLVIATLVTGELTTLDPSGRLLERLAVDDPMPTNVCLAGPDRRDLLVTLGSTGRLVRLRWPEPGW